jgi:hypothetical protein
MKSRFFLVVMIVSSVLSLFAFQPNSPAKAKSANNVSMCIVQQPNTASFPVVGVTFRLTNTADLTPITNLTENDLRFYENDKTEIQVMPGFQSNPAGSGFAYYVILDKGNRTNQPWTRDILMELANARYYNPQTDTVKIYTDEDNRANVYYPGVSGSSLQDAAFNYPIDKLDYKLRSISNSLQTVVDEVNLGAMNCSQMPVIIMVIGDDALKKEEMGRFLSLLEDTPAKVILFHLAHPSTQALNLENEYLQFTQDLRGSYVPIPNMDALDSVVSSLDALLGFRQTFSASYRTRYRVNGTHNIAASYLSNALTMGGDTSYTIQRQPGSISITNGDISIQQTSEQDTTRTLSLTLSWQDGYPLELQKQAKLHITGSEGLEEVVSITLLPRGDDYEFTWDFGSRVQQPTAKFTLFVEVFNEFGEPLQTPANQVTISAFVPEEVSSEGEIPSWLIWVLGGMALFFVSVLILFFILFQKFRSTPAQTPQEFLKSATENIKKTIVGGSNKRKPLALLYIVDGPKKMVGQDLNIITERVNLGRDPQKTDMTFYDLETNSSISGLHSIIERVNGIWRITAVSESRSETFVNGVVIEFQKPKELRSGDMVRLGYLARQPVEFQFISDIDNRLPAANARPTLSRAAASIPSAEPREDVTITVDVQAENETTQYDDGDKTAIETVDDNPTSIGLSPEEKQKIQSVPDNDVDDFINQLRGGK